MSNPPLRDISNPDLLALIAGTGRSWPGAADADIDDRTPQPESLRDAAVREALHRMEAPAPSPDEPALRSASEAYSLLRQSLARGRQERFYAVAVDARNRLISRHLVAVGTLASCVVHPREIFAPLIRRGAAAAILAHNHPSGDPAPSVEDQVLTERLARAGAILGIPLLDHLIVARNGYFSFRDAGRMG
ncbi:MAG: JAB domain-containing protein [Myxococcota bacterium]|nr:JAB domain-containing protein [Myxococcota bacterium]